MTYPLSDHDLGDFDHMDHLRRIGLSDAAHHGLDIPRRNKTMTTTNDDLLASLRAAWSAAKAAGDEEAQEILRALGERVKERDAVPAPAANAGPRPLEDPLPFGEPPDGEEEA